MSPSNSERAVMFCERWDDCKYYLDCETGVMTPEMLRDDAADRPCDEDWSEQVLPFYALPGPYTTEGCDLSGEIPF